MIDNIIEFWYLWLAAAVLAVITVFVAIKASKAAAKHNENVRLRDEEFKRLKYLSDKYADLSCEKVNDADAAELIEGISAVLQKKLEKSGDFSGEFDISAEYEKKAYAVKYFIEDVSASGLSFWCRNNGEPLISLTFSAMEDIGENRILNIMRAMYPMFDKNDDVTSYDSDRISELDKKFSAEFSRERIEHGMKEYVLHCLETDAADK